MKPLILTLSLLGMSAMLVQAGSEHLIKQRAKDLRDQNNERQGVTHPPPPDRQAPPAQPAVVPSPARPAAPALSQQATQISASLGTIQKTSTVTDEQTRQLAESLSTAARGSVKPSTSKVNRLANDLSAAIAGKDLSSSQRSMLATQLEHALNDPLNAKDMETLATAVHDAIRAAGAGRVDAKVVANDLKSIMIAIQQGAPK